MHVSLQLLGVPKLYIDTEEISVSMQRSFLLCAYLAVQADWVTRDELLLLFWPDAPEAKARQSLRSLLYKLKKEPCAAGLTLEANRLQFLAETDVDAFQEAKAKGDWAEATRLYSGDFLETYKGRESVSVENWLHQTRDELFTSWREAALYFVDELVEQADYTQAAGIMQRVLQKNALDEDAVQLYMRVQGLAGQTAKALKTFQTFKNLLEQELEMQPLEETLALAEALEQKKFESTELKAPKPKQAFVSLPSALTPFVGRTLELLELSNLLAEPENRLITLLGPGGMGKSRLALKLLEERQAEFPDGVAFVALAPLSSPADIPDALASALGLQLSAESSVEAQVFDHLQDKTMLLVFDNYEHLLDGAGVVERVLVHCPRLKVVCTSRVMLGVAGELVYDLVGLSLPAEAAEPVEAYDAVRFFLRIAQRVQPDFSLTKSDVSAVVELCAYLEGMPLAIELAAHWLRLFSVPELLSELKQDGDLLEAQGQQVSERHKSMRRVFLYSWQLLSQEEQRVLATLSVFRGGFTRDAASEVAAASTRTLLSLVNKSLLRTTTLGRFSILEVIRQYAHEKLDDEATVVAKHGEYYLDILTESIHDIRGENPSAVFEMLERDLENIRLAWTWGLERREFEILFLALEPLHRFIDARGRSEEGISIVTNAVAVAEQSELKEQRFLAHLYLRLSTFRRYLGEFELSELLNQKALNVLETLDDPPGLMSAVQGLTEAALRKGDYEKAIIFEKRAVTIAFTMNNERLIAKNLGRLAVSETEAGYFADAQEHYEEAITRFKKQSNLIGLTYNLGNLGGLLLDLGKFDEAEPLLTEALANARTMGDLFYLASALVYKAECSLKLKQLSEAKKYLLEALDLSQSTKDMTVLTRITLHLGLVHLYEGKRGKAQRYLVDSLEVARSLQDLPYILASLTAWAELLVPDHKDLAIDLFSLVALHRGSTYRDRKTAQGFLKKLNENVRQVDASDKAINGWLGRTLATADLAQTVLSSPEMA